MPDPIPADLQHYLRSFGALPDRAHADPAHDLARLALAMGAVDKNQSADVLPPYGDHIDDLARRFINQLGDAKAPTAAQIHRAWKETLYDAGGYQGDTLTYDSEANMNMIDVIDRRQGLPIALCILAVDMARKASVDLCALQWPGHVILRATGGGETRLLDPYAPEHALSAADLRALVKKHAGPTAELSSLYYEAMTARDMLVRLHNNLKLRRVSGKRYDDSLRAIDLLQWIAPTEARLDYDRGAILMRLDRINDALRAFEAYRSRITDPGAQREAALIIQELRKKLQ